MDKKAERISKRGIISADGKLLQQVGLDKVLVFPGARHMDNFDGLPDSPKVLTCSEANDLLENEDDLNDSYLDNHCGGISC